MDSKTILDITKSFNKVHDIGSMIEILNQNYKLIHPHIKIKIYLENDSFWYTLDESKVFSKKKALIFDEPTRDILFTKRKTYETKKYFLVPINFSKSQKVLLQVEKKDFFSTEEKIIAEVIASLLRQSLKNIDLYSFSSDNCTIHEYEKSILDKINETIFITDKQSKIIHTNNHITKLTGYKANEIIGKLTYEIFLPKEDWPTYKKRESERILGTEEEYDLEILKKNKQKIWVKINASPYKNSKGVICGTLGTMTDITKDKKQEEAIRGSEEAYKFMAYHSTDMISKYIDGKCTYISPASKSILGYKPEELIGKLGLDLVHADDRSELIRQHKDLSSSKIITSICRMKRKDKKYIWVESTTKIIWLEEKKSYEIITSSRDVSERKQSEAALIEQKQLLNSILDNIPVNIYLKDKEGRFLFVNKAAADSAGVIPIEVEGKKNEEVFPVQTAKHINKQDKEVWKQKKLKLESKLIMNGVEKTLLIEKMIIETGNSLQLLLGCTIDITERKKIEEKITEQQTFIQEVVDTNPNLIYVKDYEGNFIFVNEAVAKLFRTSKYEIINNDHYKIQRNKTEVDSYIKNDRLVIAKGKQSTFEESFTDADGKVIIFHSVKKPLYLPNGTTQLLGVSVDITEQKLAIEELKKSEERYRDFVENANDYIYRANADGYFTYLNPASLKILQYSFEELSTMHFSEIIRDDHKKMVIEFYQKQFTEKTKNTYLEFPVIPKIGEEFWVGQNVTMQEESGWIQGFQAFARNITKIKKAEETLINAKDLAEKSIKIKEQFISIISHEIRTPMNAVVGMTNILLQTSNYPEQKEYLNALKLSSDNLLGILNEVLEISKINSGKISFKDEDFSIVELLNNVKKSLAFKAAEKNLYLNISIDSSIPNVLQGDPIRLNQIFLNLISNSLKFTEEGGIDISITVLEETNSKIHLECKVIDSGIGISEKEIPNLFDSFVQANDEITKRYGGTGLGLAITKSLVELYGGEISVESEINQGSNFTFDIWCKKSNKKELVKTSINSVELIDKLRGIKILLVEDNKMNQLVVCNLLQRYEVDIQIAENGKEAVEKVKNNNFNLILMDLQMPVMDGYEASQQIRNKLNLKNIPIIALTASIQEEDTTLFKFGITDFIIKPFEPSLLYKKIAEHCSTDQPSKSMSDSAKSERSKKKITNLSYLIEASGGDKNFMRDMINIFLNQTPGFLNILHEAILVKDWEKYRKAMHKLKPTIFMMGIKMENEIQEIENNTKKLTGLEDIPKLTEHLSKICRLAYGELEKEITKLNKK